MVRKNDFAAEIAQPYYHLRYIDATRSPVCGLAMLNPGWTHMRRCLETESVLLVGKKGRTVIEDNGTRFELTAGSMLLLPAGHVHRGVERAKEPLSYWWFHFYQCVALDDELRLFLPRLLSAESALPALSAPEKSSALFKNGIIVPQTMALSKPELVGNLCGEALQAFAAATVSPLAYYNALQRLFLELGRDAVSQAQKAAQSNEPETAAGTLVRQILVLVEEQLSNPNASVKLFADKLGVNADYLGRCFKEVTASPLWQYINRRRVELACTRLRESNRNAEDIAAECGFGSRRQFFDVFKQHTGKTPSEYRSESAYTGVNSL